MVKRDRVVILFVGIFVVVVIALWAMSRMRRERARVRMARALAVAEARDENRVGALRAALGGAVVARPDLGACPFDVATSARAHVVSGRVGGPGAFRLEAMRDVARSTDATSIDASRADDVERAVASWSRELDVVDELGAPPRAGGRAYVYDFRAERIVCAGAFDASADSEPDRERLAVEDARGKLFAAGPPR